MLINLTIIRFTLSQFLNAILNEWPTSDVTTNNAPVNRIAYLYCSVIFVNENENGEKRENNEFVNEN